MGWPAQKRNSLKRKHMNEIVKMIMLVMIERINMTATIINLVGKIGSPLKPRAWQKGWDNNPRENPRRLSAKSTTIPA